MGEPYGEDTVLNQDRQNPELVYSKGGLATGTIRSAMVKTDWLRGFGLFRAGSRNEYDVIGAYVFE